MTKLVAALMFLVTFAVAAGLYSVGAPWWAAALLAFVLVGAGGIAAGHRTGGAAFVVAGAAAGLYGLHDLLPDLPLWIVLVGGTVVEVALAVLVWTAARRLRGPAAGLARRRLAVRHGWTFRPRATVALPGPMTAPLLKNVPGGAADTLGTDVLEGTEGGFRVQVFDRRRPGGRPAEGVQTVWFVRLRRPASRSAASPPPGLPNRWWTEGPYLCAATDGHAPRGATAAEIEETLTRLVAFARALESAT
ncbi:hypothetical protein ABZS66_46435 [Dactylosporangium sp. NPDC005572]|uniref:hypothetical protein n=1 Tax=Dactylosporangium sp. NPDC005572 TaxID=3156889 RepID=UPI00339E717E